MTLRYDTVTLLSDFGHRDAFVGVMHSVLRQMAPGVSVIDLNHEIDPFDVRAGSWCLARTVQYLAPGVIVGVVDPGVGTDRRGIAIEAADGNAVFVGPDNGLLTSAVSMIGGAERVVELNNPAFHLPSHATTFDGRDVFCPVAAHLCMGVPFDELGDAVDPNQVMPGLVPIARWQDDHWEAEVLMVDRFGNVQLNLGPDDLGDAAVMRLDFDSGSRIAKPTSSFGALGTGELGLLVDADGLIAVVSARSSAAEELGCGVGDLVRLAPSDEDQRNPTVASVQLAPKRRR